MNTIKIDPTLPIATAPASSQSPARFVKKFCFVLLAALGIFAFTSASAANLYWSGDGATQGGAGTWGTNGFNFGLSPSGPFSQVWTGGAGDNAVFESTGGTVVVSGPTLRGDILVNSSGYLFSGDLIFAAPVTADVPTGVSATFSQINSGEFSLTKTGAGTLIINAANSYTGGFNFNDGRVHFNNSAAAGSGVITVGAGAVEFVSTAAGVRLTNDIVLSAGANPVIYAGTGNVLTNAGIISGPGGLIRNDTGAGTLALLGSNTFSGGFKITSRAVVIGNSSAFGTGTLTIGDSAAAPATGISIALNAAAIGSGIALTNAVVINRNVNFSATAMNSIALAGPVTLPTQILLTNNGTLTISGAISGNGGFTKYGSGFVNLLGSNIYSGPTTLSGGILRVNNIVGSATGSGAVNITLGTLMGIGSVSGPVTVAGNISPGNIGTGVPPMQNIGTLSTGSETWAGGGRYSFDILAANGSPGNNFGWDQLNITGGVNLTATTGSKFSIFVTSQGPIGAGQVANFNNASNYTWSIVHTTAGFANFDTNLITLNTSSFANDLNGGKFGLATTATDLLLRFTPAGAAEQAGNFITTSPGQGRFNGSPNTSYAIEYANNLTTPMTWQFLMTATTDSAGVGTFSDASAPNGQPQRYYRVKNP